VARGLLDALSARQRFCLEYAPAAIGGRRDRRLREPLRPAHLRPAAQSETPCCSRAIAAPALRQLPRRQRPEKRPSRPARWALELFAQSAAGEDHPALAAAAASKAPK